MPAATSHLNRTEIVRSFALVGLIIIMDMSGLAGLAAQDELDERQEVQSTHSGLNAPGFMTGVASQKSTFDFGNWGNSACAVMDNGELACWGSGDRYLIYQNTSNSITPVVRDDFPSGISVSEISLGAYHRCALMSNSKVYCWGSAYPSFGGQSFTYNRASPTVVQDSAGNDILATQVSSDGDSHSCAILINGSAVCWGYNYYGQLGVGYRCVTGAEGDCQSAWNDYNQEYLEMPTQVVIPSGRTVVALNTHPGDAHGTCFVLDDGSYMCAGSSFGTQGTPVYANQSYNGDIIYDVVAASGRSVTLSNGDIRYLQTNGVNPYIGHHLSASTYDANGSYQGSSYFEHSVSNYWGECSLFNNGSVACDDISYGINGVTSRFWVQIPAGVEASAVIGAAGAHPLCIVYSNGSAQCLGDNDAGQLGTGYACIYGTSDPNGCTSNNHVTSLRWLILPSGRHIALHEADTDGDDIWDILDQCPSSSISWTSDPTNDHDQDGCRDVDEDDDDNGDGITDTDYDGDGYGDLVDDDDDNDGVTDPDVDSDGYGDNIDFDGDGYDNIDDDFIFDSTEWLDTDSDGIGDNADTDDDGDGYDDSVDTQPLDPMFHHTLTMDDGWVVGGRYENVSAACNTGSDYIVSEFESSTIRSVPDCSVDYAISTNNQLVTHSGISYNVNWDTSDGVIAVAGQDQKCVILESGALRCWGYNSYGQIGAGYTGGSHNDPDQSVNVSFPVNYGVKHILTRGYFTAVVLENGEAYIWGYSQSYTYLGVGFTCNYNDYTNGCDGNNNLVTPAQIQLPPGSLASGIYSALESYDSHRCITFTDGNAACWGSNGKGQLGDGTTNDRVTPTEIYLPNGITSDIVTMSLSGGENDGSTCALWANGSIYCWGMNDYGQLGDGTICPGNNYENNCNGYQAKPIIYDPVVLPSGTFAIALWRGGNDAHCSLLSSGGIWCWGDITNSVNGTGAYQNWLSTGDFIQPGNRDWDSDGVYNTEDNCAAGTQGWTSTSSNDFDSDGCIDATEDDDDDGDSYSDSTEIACGTDPLNGTDIPLDPDNDGICNAFDDDDDNDGVLDVNDEFPNDPYGFVQLSLGDGFQSGQPEDNATLGGSGHTTCAILTDGTLRCWGYNYGGQIGDGTRGTQRYTPTNVSLPTGKTPVSVSASSSPSSYSQICAIMDDGSLYCWGNNYFGQIGVGTNCESGSYINGCNGNQGRSSPSQVSLPVGLTAEAVATGHKHTCAILDDGSVWCWGNNEYGQLGVGNSSNSGDWRYSPNAVMMPSGVSAVAISLGNYHSCMVVDDGRAFCWGEGDAGRLGHGSQGDQNLPVQVSGTASYVSISLGEGHSCAITNLATAQCWGYGSYGQIGDGGGGERHNPTNVALPPGTSVSSISAGYQHTCAVTESLSVYCWGNDDYNRLNTAYNCDNDYSNGCHGSNRVTPALSQLPTGRGGIAVFAGERYTCVFIDNGGIYCFGENDYGQLGNGSTGTYGPTYVGMPVGVSPQTNDRDLDHDGVFNNEDACMEGETGWTSNNTTDNDGDGCQDSSEDLDDDNDFLNDTDEATLGTNSTNPDTDGDGYLDGLDAFPLNSTEWSDVDSDGIGDNADTDDDNDLWSDTDEVACNTDPLNGTDTPVDTDGDSQCNYLDSDDDGDGVADVMDAFPLDPSATTDTDGDGLPDSLNGNSTTNLTEDLDDDNDFWNDTDEIACGTNPLSNSSVPVDSDNDTVCDPLDAFPNDSSEWADSDSDGVGDNSDAFPNDSNETSDNDGDGLGDNADTDDDNDNWSDSDEVACLTDPLDNSSIPGDIDADGICDALELDLDNDGWTNANESYCGTDWNDVNSVPVDTDGDMICDIMDYDDDGDLVLDVDDAFPLDGTEWLDSDGDGIGNNADPDDDNDGCMDLTDDLPLDPTECYDTDNDGEGDNADLDDDGDGLLDADDPFPLDASATVDTDGDGYPDFLNGTSTTGLVADWDDDNDGWNDTDDAFPLDATEWLDTDMDGQGNNADLNDDGDPCLDVDDAFPLDASECYDTDGDGVGNNADPDDDNDGWLDTTESICGTSDPLNASSVPDDFDGDGVCDLLDYDDDNDSYIDTGDAFPFDPCAAVDSDGDGDPDWISYNCNTTLTEDLDDDNDGIDDTEDVFPLDPNEWQDTDGDGMGDNSDPDVDGDQVPNEYDMFPYNSTEWADNDGDGIGDNADLDDDNDGVLDDNDDFPLDPAASLDTDGDGMPDTLVANVTTSLVEDLDDDGDGVLDIYDWAPLDPTEWVDTDGDGIGDNADADDDGDGWSDSDEYICGTNHLDANSVPPDGDGDGICDSQDSSDTSTLSGRIQYYMNSPVTVWMAVVGVLCALVIGATGSSLRSAKERRMLIQQTIDYSDSVSGHEEFGTVAVGQVEIPIPKMTPSRVGKQELVEKYMNQGYSSEVANILADDELKN